MFFELFMKEYVIVASITLWKQGEMLLLGEMNNHKFA